MKLRNVSFLLLIMLFVVAFAPAALAQDGAPIETVCLVTDLGKVDDNTFNEYAHEGAVAAVEDYDLDEYSFIETESETDYEDNIGTCVQEEFDVIVTVGFLIQDATLEAARANPDIHFIGVDQDLSAVEDAPENYVGIQFREDQAGFLVGALAALVANDAGEDVIAGIYGIDVPAVKRFRNGFEQGALYVNPEWEIGTNILGNYESSFVDPTVGISAANQYIGEGAYVIFGAGGPMGSAGIAEAAAQGTYVIGVDQDEYFSTFGEGTTAGAEFLISSAIKRVDQGVYDMIAALAEGDFDAFPGGQNYLLDISLAGVGFAPRHDSDIPEELYAQLEDIMAGMIAGEVETGVDPVSGDLLEEGAAEPVATEEASG